MDKLERLLNLTAALLHADRPLTAEELRVRVGGYPEAKASFQRSFARDKDDLRSMGIPLRVQAVPGVDPPIDGYRLLRDEYAGADLRFDPDELAALHLATNLVRLDGGDDGLVKLGAVQPDSAAERLGNVPFTDSLAVLIGAAADRRAVSFGYGGTPRVAEPWRLSFSRGHWYLQGWDRVRSGERLYRVDRIEGVVQLAGQAEENIGPASDPLVLRGWELGDGPATSARVAVDADQAAWARHMLGSVEECADGSVVATLQVRNGEAFRSFVLSFLEHAEVLEPPELRADLIEWLEAQQ